MKAWRVVACLALVAPSQAFADDTHYQDFIIGGRAVGLGGAFCAIADDPSGLYYNPAGIADSQRSNLQLDTSLYGFERGSIDQATLPVPGVTNFQVNFTDLIVVPASAGFVTAFGQRGNDGLSQQAYGVSVIVPSYRSYSLTTGAGPLNANTQGSYQRRVTDRELWAGIGYGRKLGSNLRVGLSGYYVLRTLTDNEDVSLVQSLGNGQQRFETVTNDISVVAGSIVLIAGAKYLVNADWTLGLALQAPSIQTNGAAELNLAQSFADPSAGPGQATYQTLDITSPAQTNYAFALRLGAAYRKHHRYTLVADVSFHAPTRYQLVQVSSAYHDRLPFNPDIMRGPVANFNLGAEVLVVREVSVAAGVYSDFSSAANISANPTSDQPPQVNLFGVTLSLGFFGNYTLSRIGVVYSLGQGYDVIPAPAQTFQSNSSDLRQFARVRYFQSFFYVFASSSFRY